MSDTDRLAELLIEVFPATNRNQWPFAATDVATALIAAGVRVAPSPETPGPLTDWDTGYVHAIRDHDECCGTLRNHSPGVAPSPETP